MEAVVPGNHAYRPLDCERKQFRLLEVEQGCNLLKCRLLHTSLTNDPHPQYETISYAWGDPSLQDVIEIDSVLVSMPASSVAAVMRMRLPDRNRVLWIDAICVNQKDLDERAQQVSFMNEIYAKSGGNLIHLGEATSTTDAAARTIELLLEDIKMETRNFENFGSTIYDRSHNCLKTSKKGFNCEEPLDFEALNDLFARPWFRRLWVTPETLLAPLNVACFGRYEVPLLDLMRVVVWTSYKIRYARPYPVNIHADRLESWWHALDSSQSPYGKSFFRDTYDILAFGSSRECSDERDRVYALLGLLGDRAPRSLKPDYHRPVIDVMCEATRHALGGENESLHCWSLRAIDHQSQQEFESGSWPSWVPRWGRNRTFHNRLSNFFMAAGGRLQDLSSASDFHTLFWSPNSIHELVLPGFPIDEVAEVAAILTETIYFDRDLLLAWMEEALKLWKRTMRSNEGVNEFAMMLISGQDFNGEQASEDTWQILRRFLTFLRQRGIPKTVLLGSSNEEDVAVTEYYLRMRSQMTGWRPFRTRSGRLGTAPQVIDARDIVVIVYGCKWPVVLRRGPDDTYRIAGVCYLHGVMYGEAMDAHLAADIPDKIFRIR